MSLAVRIKDLRLKRGESLQATADAVGTSKAHIWQIERGKADNPSIGLIRKLADHFSVTVAYLVGEDTNASDADQELTAMFRQASEFSENEREILRGMMKTLAAASSKGRSPEQ